MDFNAESAEDTDEEVEGKTGYVGGYAGNNASLEILRRTSSVRFRMTTLLRPVVKVGILPRRSGR